MAIKKSKPMIHDKTGFSHLIFFFLGLGALSGCQIHKPVPVEHITVHSSTSQAQKPQVSAPRVQAQPEQVAWSPIQIDPIGPAQSSAPNGPTEPLTEYQFEPHPKAAKKAAQKTASNRAKYTKPVAATQAFSHVVKRGESLYGIAKSYGMDVSTIAKINGLSQPYQIYPNQKLALRGDRALAVTTEASAAASKATNTARNRTAQTRSTSQSSVKKAGNIRWAWPATGQLIATYKDGVTNGIEIGGEPGKVIRASADGTVLYSGNEVTGYGELIILDHGNGFMSTYAHNRRLNVSQGAVVKRGDKIAEMGSSESERTKLHFEIRKGEKPVNPLTYLPAR